MCIIAVFMSSSLPSGCTKHLFIIAGLCGAVVAYGIVQNWSTFSLMVDNLTVMNEKAEQAESLRYPRDVLDYLAAHPDKASLVAYDVGAKADGIFYRADTARALTEVPQLLLMAEYARQVGAGQLAPTRPVPLDSLDVYALPGSGQRQHRTARQALIDSGRVDPDSTVALHAVARNAFQEDDPAAADWLMAHLGPAAVRQAPARFRLPNSDPPLPNSGTQLLWTNHTQTASSETRIDTLANLSPGALSSRAYAQMERLRRDSTFRRTERQRLTQHGSGLSLREQRTLARYTAPRGTAAEYANLLARVAQGALINATVADSLQPFVERSFARDSVALSIRTVGSVGGATPGLISLAGYAKRAGDTPPRVVVLLLEGLPMAVFYHLLQTGLDKGFHLQLLGDDAFFEQVRRRLHSDDQASP
jgi:hypothetical protein